MSRRIASAEQPATPILIPAWVVDRDNPALARMAPRPVLVAIDDVAITLRAQVVDLTMTHAVLRPTGRFYLYRNIYTEISFRFEMTRYTLAGEAESSERDRTIRLNFDAVARLTLANLGKRLLAVGLMRDACEEPAAGPGAEAEPGEAEPALLKSHNYGRLVRNLGPPKGVERRRHPRFQVEVGVRLTLVDRANRIECSMLDLSLGGCRLYFESPHVLPKGARIELQFIGDGLPFRLPAVVQAVHHVQALGVRFSNAPRRMQERLEWLVDELAEEAEAAEAARTAERADAGPSAAEPPAAASPAGASADEDADAEPVLESDSEAQTADSPRNLQ